MSVPALAARLEQVVKTNEDVRRLAAQLAADRDFEKWSERTIRKARPDADAPGRLEVGHLSPGLIRGEQISWAIALCRNARLTGRVRNAFGDQATARWSLASLTASAVPYLWKRELMLTALSLPLPDHVVGSDLFPHDVMYWSPDRELQIMNPGSSWSSVMVQGFLVARTTWGYQFGVFTTAAHADLGVVGACDIQQVAFGARYPDDLRDGIGESLLKLAAFVNSPFIAIDRVERHTSKQARKRYGPRIGDPVSLNVVRLRSEVREAVRVERGDGPRWKQRWLVRGHYRAQWYPATASHRVIWIAPYLKGPDDAPLKQPTYAVVR